LVNKTLVVDALAQNLKTGAIKEVSPEDVLVVSPLEILRDPEEKARRILDATFVNALNRYVPFHYESLGDIAVLEGPTHLVLMTGLICGYDHISLHHTDYRVCWDTVSGQDVLLHSSPIWISVCGQSI
jgi:hypothetical protein